MQSSSSTPGCGGQDYHGLLLRQCQWLPGPEAPRQLSPVQPSSARDRVGVRPAFPAWGQGSLQSPGFIMNWNCLLGFLAGVHGGLDSESGSWRKGPSESARRQPCDCVTHLSSDCPATISAPGVALVGRGRGLESISPIELCSGVQVGVLSQPQGPGSFPGSPGPTV